MRERRISGAHLSLSWHHTRSFCQRSRAESEQSRGSFARRAIIFILAGKGRVEASDAPRRLWIYEFESPAGRFFNIRNLPEGVSRDLLCFHRDRFEPSQALDEILTRWTARAENIH
jgi:hypothetical protein